jgi:hypothetical protein
MKRAVLSLALLVGLVSAGSAFGAVQVGITSPATGAHSLSGIVPVTINASADAGIYDVQLNVDGVPYGAADTTPTGPYQYEIDWNTAGLPSGNHILTVTALDWSQPFPNGVTQTSAPVTVDVGPAYPTVTVTTPASWTFVKGTAVPLTAVTTSALDPTTVAFSVDGAAVTTPWNSTTVADGSHTITATVTDGRGKQATASATVTVDNTPPLTYIQSPAASSSFTGTMPVSASASDSYGVASVQFDIDGKPVGAPVTQVSSPYSYTATLSLAGLTNGIHQLTSVATNQAGSVTTSTPVAFNVGVAPLAVAITTPANWSFISKTATISSAVTNGTGPYSVQYFANGVAVSPVLTTSPYTLSGSTVVIPDGSYTIYAKVTDSKGATATSPVLNEVVDNTAPTAVMYAPTANSRVIGITSLQVHASDAWGVKSIKFLIDGVAVGTTLTVSDTPGGYLYTSSYDTTALTAGTHSVSALVTDNAGNTTTAVPVTITTGPVNSLPVLNFHGIENLGTSPYDLTSTEADTELAWLKAQGYESVTLEQYQQWLKGANIGIAKPILLTVDDAVTIDEPWDALLKKYGFTAVMFVVTGFADNSTPGDTVGNMSWSQIQALAADGHWQIAFHAGQYGHGTEYGNGVKIGTQLYQAACPYFYSCLSGTNKTTVTLVNGKLVTTTTWVPETVAQLKTAVTNELAAGMAELKAKVPTADFLAWAVPFNDAGQWTNLYNDSSNQVQAWLPGFMASKFPIVFTQTDPASYSEASGTVGSLTGFDREYRFEVDGSTTLAQFIAALGDPGFTR